MQELLIIITALIFYALGRFSGQETIEKTVKQIKRKINPPHTGVIDYPTPKQIEYEGSNEQKADQARNSLFEDHFKL